MVMFRSNTVAFLLVGSAWPALTGSTPAHSLLDRTKQTRLVRRDLLPHPPRPPHPPHLGHGAGKYMGCLGLSTEKLEEVSRFKDDMPKCEIVVDGTTVVANTVSSSASTESDSSNGDVATTTTSTVAVYEEVTSSQSDTSGGSDDNIEDQDDEVNENDDDDGNQSSATGGEENNEDDVTNSIQDTGNTSESGASSGNDAASDESNAENQVSDGNTTVDENSATEGSPNPLHLFDMKDCGSFSALWMWDLALTCSNSTSLDSCSCTAAKILIQYGDIDCTTDECPVDCPVCDMCMKLSECGPIKELQRGAVIEDDTADTVPIAFIGLTAAMFGIQLVLFKVYWSRRTQPGGALGSHLMDQNVV
eukprot:scaffold5951_cov99-Skeletonema_marinoi.AAC.2